MLRLHLRLAVTPWPSSLLSPSILHAETTAFTPKAGLGRLVKTQPTGVIINSLSPITAGDLLSHSQAVSHTCTKMSPGMGHMSETLPPCMSSFLCLDWPVSLNMKFGSPSSLVSSYEYHTIMRKSTITVCISSVPSLLVNFPSLPVSSPNKAFALFTSRTNLVDTSRIKMNTYGNYL